MPWTILGNWVPKWNTQKYPVYSLAQILEAQRRFVEDSTLPIQMSSEARNELSRVGVIFGEIDRNDPIFQFVQLPPGCFKLATDHPLYTWLIDESGGLEAMIYYKPAFFALKAHLYLI